MNRFMLLLFIPVVAFPLITTKTQTFTLNDYVNLTTGAFANVPKPTGTNAFFYPCSTSALNRDFFMNYADYSVCICPCPSGAIGSPRPFYKSKKSFVAMDLNTQLDLKDTMLFTRIDTILKNQYTDVCSLPFFLQSQYESSVVIVTTSAKNYTLIRVDPSTLVEQCTDISTGTPYTWNQTHLKGFTITWYVQSNGSPYFPGINQTGVNNMPAPGQERRTAKMTQKNEIYSLLGQRVPFERIATASRRPGAQSIYIVKAEGGIRLLLR